MRFALAFIGATSFSMVYACDCTTYPFSPNPPCYGQCVSKLAAEGDGAIASVKNLDPGVKLSIQVLARSKSNNKTDWTAIRQKSDLEQAAQKVFSTDF